MTRFAFISDIHGNFVRLEQALADSEPRGAERYICLGDIVGGQASEHCWNALKARNTVAVKGNVDASEWLPPTLQADIDALPLLTEMDDGAGHRMLLVHGAHYLESSFSSDMVARDLPGLAQRLRARGCKLMLFGHTHRPRAWRIIRDNVEPITSIKFDLDWGDPDACYIINVGPIQRPSPGELNNGRPCYFFYDSQASHMEHILL